MSRKTMCGWHGALICLKPLYGMAKEILLESKVIGTDDTGVKVLDYDDQATRRKVSCRDSFGRDESKTTAATAQPSLNGIRHRGNSHETSFAFTVTIHEILSLALKVTNKIIIRQQSNCATP
jgi:hypothetical protein